MDIYYLGDTLPFSPSMRSPATRDFEKFPIGSLEQSPKFKSAYAIAQAKTEQKKSQSNNKKDSCPFCKEQKKKPLAAYMRKRQFSKRADSICEEEEEAVQTREHENHKVDQKK